MPEHPHHIRSEAYKYRFDLLFASLLCTIVVNIFFPEVLALSGGVANQGDALLLPLRERVRERSFGSRYAVSHTRIELCTLGYRAGVIGAAMLARIGSGAFIVAMCIEGKGCSSEELASLMAQCAVQGKSRVCFLIGGSDGLSDEVKRAADVRLSMSRMTFPHHLARVMVLEQIYRAFNINEGGKYHK